MPDPYERHSRPNGCCENWYGQPSRSQLRAAVVAEQAHPEAIPQGKRPPGRKDRNLCKAAHWKGPHQPEIRMRQDAYATAHGRECLWDASWVRDGPVWVCRHEEACTGCGKILRDRLGQADCPDFRPIADAERVRIEAEIAQRNDWRESRKPAIVGPQGYRRKRGAA